MPRAQTLAKVLLPATLCLLVPALFLPARAGSRLDVIRHHSRFEIQIGDGAEIARQHELVDWVKKAADAVAAYYGHFPLRAVLVRVEPTSGRGIGFSTAAVEGNRAVIEVPVGVATTAADFNRDWTLTHEMMHLAFPLMDGDNLWLAEGIATYVEPIGRMQAGHLKSEEVWGELVSNLPRGLPGGFDRGLKRDKSIGRTYWGGALYCLIADIRIHQQTAGRQGLQEALRAINDSGGNIASGWSATRALAEGDRATGRTILKELYSRMGESPLPVDLRSLWEQLGVRQSGGKIAFDDSAPLAWIRRSIDRKRLTKLENREPLARKDR